METGPTGWTGWQAHQGCARGWTRGGVPMRSLRPGRRTCYGSIPFARSTFCTDGKHPGVVFTEEGVYCPGYCCPSDVATSCRGEPPTLASPPVAESPLVLSCFGFNPATEVTSLVSTDMHEGCYSAMALLTG